PASQATRPPAQPAPTSTPTATPTPGFIEIVAGENSTLRQTMVQSVNGDGQLVTNAVSLAGRMDDRFQREFQRIVSEGDMGDIRRQLEFVLRFNRAGEVPWRAATFVNLDLGALPTDGERLQAQSAEAIVVRDPFTGHTTITLDSVPVYSLAALDERPYRVRPGTEFSVTVGDASTLDWYVFGRGVIRASANHWFVPEGQAVLLYDFDSSGRVYLEVGNGEDKLRQPISQFALDAEGGR
ncbi:MAG: hypothetical protein L0177_18900, partial [Chloroflexi bacterium]|nr:hypothetical protein [Chloroflexota bacterium]